MTEKKFIYNDPLLIPGLKLAIAELEDKLRRLESEEDKIKCRSAELFDTRSRFEHRLHACEMEADRVKDTDNPSTKSASSSS